MQRQQISTPTDLPGMFIQYASCLDSRKSRTGYLFLIAGRPVHGAFDAKTARPNPPLKPAEYMGLSEVGSETI